MEQNAAAKGKDLTCEIEQAAESLRLRNAELRGIISHLQKENTMCKLRHNKLKLQLSNLNTLLEKNATILNDLFVGTSNALQMCKIPFLKSPLRRQSAPPAKSSPAGPSTVVAPTISAALPTRNLTRRRLHIEPLNMQELQEMSENAAPANHNEGDEVSLREGLSTILEENTRELSVKLSRLPLEVVIQHLKKQNRTISTSSSEVNESFESKLEPTYSSTPLKVEAMRMLGLIPSPNNSIPEFVSVRKKSKTNARSNGLVFPKEERISSLEKPQTPKRESLRSSLRETSLTPKRNNKKRRQSPEPEPENGRPKRQARPKTLKEESLKKKKRRN